MSRCPLAALAALLAMLSAAGPAGAAPVPADGGKGTTFPFPSKAPLVVAVSGYDTARDRLGKMLAAALPKDAELLTKMLDDALGQVFRDRKLTAVRKDARAFLVVNDLMGLGDDTPSLSVLVPVTGHKDFLDSFLTRDELKSLDRGRDGVDGIRTFALGDDETNLYLVDLKEYTAITPDKPTAEAYAAKYTAAGADQMGTDLAETFLKADVALYVNMDAVNDQFGDQIRGFKGLIDFALQQAQEQGALGALNKKQIEGVKTMLKGLLQGVEDCRAVVGAAEFRPNGLYVKLQVRLAENSVSAKTLGSQQPGTLAELGKLPAGMASYSAMRLGKPFSDVLRDLGQEFATTDDDARGAELIEMHMKDLAAAKPGGDFAASSPPGTAITVTPYEDADKAAKALSKAFKAVAAGGRVSGIVVKTAPRVGDEAETHRGFTFSSVNLNYDFEASVAGLPEQVREATLEGFRRTTPEKAVQWVGSDGKVVARLIAPKWEDAKKLFDQYLDGKGGIGTDPAFKRVREQLPAEANWITVIEVGAALDGMLASLKSVAELVPGFPRLGDLKKPDGAKPAYLGFAVALKGDTVTATGFVPAAAIDSARKMLDSLLKKIE